MKTTIAAKDNDLERAGLLLEGVSYQRVLDRGFALITDARDQPVTAAAGVSMGQELGIQFGDGKVSAKVTAMGSGGGGAMPKKKKKKPADDGQGTLL